VPPGRVRFHLAIFCLKIVQILGPAFWTEVGFGLDVAVEDIYILI